MPDVSGFDAMASVYAVLRWCSLAGLVTVGGAALCAVLTRPAPPRARLALVRLLGAAWATGSAGLVGLLLLPGPVSSPAVRLRATLLVLLTACWALGRYGIGDPWPTRVQRVLAAGGGAALVLTAAGCQQLAELPAQAPVVPALLLTQSVQLAATAGWLGGSAALAALLIAARGEPEALAAARRFTPAGLVSLHLLMAVTSMQAWQTLGAAPAVLGTPYGRLLLAQLGALTLLLALDALARACLHRTPAAPGGVVRVVLHRTLATQLLLGAALFAVAGPLPLWSPGFPLPPSPAG
ncbi:hypothetical protein AB0M28_18095 [Streptomyces sp. NPDC051940]|uniref:hypothetical protein n=1 Tax=Streptomyces sp. NPDC051940 TaxID=3155675 RepID=UPI0034220F48